MDVEFVTRVLERDWPMEVRLCGVLVGHIRSDPASGTYRYFRLPKHALVPLYVDTDLEALKRRVARRP